MHTLNLGTHALLVGQIEEVHVSEECLTNGEPDILKINPIIYCTGEKKAYFTFGQSLADAFSVGLEVKKARK
jgi:flavin reductase (DIM6/NTAB) family NADH-FMN oxidoreductase RutF